MSVGVAGFGFLVCLTLPACIKQPTGTQRCGSCLGFSSEDLSVQGLGLINLGFSCNARNEPGELGSSHFGA